VGFATGLDVPRPSVDSPIHNQGSSFNRVGGVCYSKKETVGRLFGKITLQRYWLLITFDSWTMGLADIQYTGLKGQIEM